MRLLLVLTYAIFGYASVNNGKKCSDQVVLVTGGLGFIGSHTVESLLQKGYQVKIMDDVSNGHNFNKLAQNVTGKIGDITVVDNFDKIPGKVDYIIHLAAAISVAESMSDPGKYDRTNVHGSRNVLEFSHKNGVKMVVAASSAAVYGDIPDKLPIVEDENTYGGKSPYARTKWEMEKLMEQFNKDKGLKSTALRFFNVYGPRQDPTSPYSGVISKFMDMSNKKQDVTVFGDGLQTRDFIYVKDIARAIITAMESGRSQFGAFNVCTGKETTVKDLAGIVIDLFQGQDVISKVKHGPPRDGDIKKSVCNPTKAKELLGFQYQYKVEDGLKATRDWFLGK